MIVRGEQRKMWNFPQVDALLALFLGLKIGICRMTSLGLGQEV